MSDKLKKRKDKFWTALTAVVIIAILLCRIFVFEFINISGDSMYPTLQNNQLIFVWKPSYNPARGDIIVFYTPDNIELVKRVIGLPRETIEIKEGVVYINNKELEQKYQYPSPLQASMPAVTIPDDCIFVLGDNRDKSDDSRTFGAINMDKIKGKMLFIVY